MSQSIVKVTRIGVYPIKATREIVLQQSQVGPHGLSHDRRWVLADEAGQFISQRTHPQLALVATQLGAGGSVDVTAPGMPSLSVTVPGGEERVAVRVWDDVVDAACAGSAAAAWFSEYLKVPCRLAFMDARAVRPVSAPYGRAGDVVSFADGMPLLLATEVSLADLNRRCGQTLAMSRFRPNVTVDGDVAWDEDRWRQLRIGTLSFDVTHPCARCVVTTIEQQTGRKQPDGEPLTTLATFRRDDKGVNFGLNLIPRGSGTIHVGDKVTISARDD